MGSPERAPETLSIHIQWLRSRWISSLDNKLRYIFIVSLCLLYFLHLIPVEIPFQFSVGAKTFSAGEYSLKPLLPGTVLLRDQAGQVLTSIGTNSIESLQAPRTVKLVFNGYAGQYFLTQIWNAGDSIGREVIKSPTEVEMARKYSPGQQIALRVVAHR